MADKAITDLIEAEQMTKGDWFLLEQGGTAKKLRGQTMVAFLTALADGHGGISGIQKTGTSGLVDTYRIRFADNTAFEFTVTNGEKGDRGDNAYTWIKYASKEPTASAHTMGDLPDRWMGVYAGNSASAPIDWQQYKWFEIKGQKGDTGAPATISASAVTYQVGTSATSIPTGQWSESIPETPQGAYLWSKTVTQFNTGSPITVYAVSRVGRDGLGTLRTINGIEADENGNIALSAGSVGALSKTGDTLEGMLDANGNRITGIPSPSEAEDAVPLSFFANMERTAWQNLSATSEFAAQTVGMNNANAAERIVIEFRMSSEDDTIVSTPELALPRAGQTYNYVICAPSAASGRTTIFASRKFSVYGNKSTMRVTFDNTYEGTIQENTKLIPLYVTTIRKVT